MKLFNTMTKSKEEFKPIHLDKITMYVCGPTVYNHAHIGNVRPMIVFDVLRRLFEFKGKTVIHVSNYTDIDDKIIQQAKKAGVSEHEISSKYIEAYQKVRVDLNLLQPTYTPKVTDMMEDIVCFISKLIEHGYAYCNDGDVYFRVSKITQYGELSGIKIGDLMEGASQRVEENLKKECPLDFTLWKATDQGLHFESPWSNGRPGWHTECVVMIYHLFNGEKIDIHGGGQDLKFPHHENEIAQSMALFHHPIANYWMHNQMININNQKMSKSLGNVVWAKDAITLLGANHLKWLMLSTHYRNPLNFTDEVVENVKKEVDKVTSVIKQASLWLQVNKVPLNNQYDTTLDQMVNALEDDLNTSLALTKILEQVKHLNQLLRLKEKDSKNIAIAYNTLMQMTNLLGFKFDIKTLSQDEIDLYLCWLDCKNNKAYEQADILRSQLMELGVI